MKKLSIIISILAISCLTSETSHSAEYWAKTYGGSENEFAFSGQQTTDDGYIATGYTSSFGFDFGFFWVVKLESDGTVTWQKTYEQDTAYAIQQTTDGGYIVAGEIWTVDAYTDFKVLKLDSSGNVTWQKTYGGSNLELPSSILQTTDGGYIVAGYTAIDVDSDFWVLRLDSSGNVIWQNTYGGSSIDFLVTSSIQQTLDGGYIVAGGAYSFGAGGADFWVLKLDSDGTVTWQKTYGGSEGDRATSIQQTLDGGYIVAGFTESFGAGLYDNWVLKLDSSGNVTWQKTYGGSEGEFYSYIKQTTDEGYIMASTTESFGAGYYDIWIIKLDNNGNVSWEKTYGGSDGDEPRSIQQTLDGGHIVSGYTKSFGAGGRDFWVLKLNSNGEIPGCNFMSTSNATVYDTSVSGVNTSITAQAYSSTATDTSITPQDTSAIIDTICPVDVRIDIGDSSGFRGSVNNAVSVDLDNPDDLVRGLQLDICDVDDYLICTSCELSGRAAGFNCFTNDLGNGCCTVILHNTDPASNIERGTGTILTVAYEVAGDAPGGECKELNPEDVLVSDYDGYDLEVISFPGEFCFLDCTSDGDCDDDNVCTDEVCVDSACQHTYNINPCPDDLFCNGEEYCGNGWCAVGPGDIPCPIDDELFCNGMEECDEENDVCTHSGNPCQSGTQCNEATDTCDPITASSIPTSSEWGMIIFMTIIMGLGVVILFRRKIE